MRRAHINVTIDAKLVEKLRKLAKEDGRSLSNTIERFLLKSVEKK